MSELSPTDVRIVAAALECATQEEAARAAGVSLRTFQRRRATAPVRDAIARAAAEQLAGITVSLARHASAAVDTLGAMSAGTLVPHGPRVKAAAALVTLALKVRELDIGERLAAALEGKVEPSPSDFFGAGGSS